MKTIIRDAGNGPETHYNISDAAARYGISRTWLYELIRRGKIKSDYWHDGRRWVAESEMHKIRSKRHAM
jgi:predicted site-specific integrase-resolvase